MTDIVQYSGPYYIDPIKAAQTIYDLPSLAMIREESAVARGLQYFRYPTLMPSSGTGPLSAREVRIPGGVGPEFLDRVVVRDKYYASVIALLENQPELRAKIVRASDYFRKNPDGSYTEPYLETSRLLLEKIRSIDARLPHAARMAQGSLIDLKYHDSSSDPELVNRILGRIRLFKDLRPIVDEDAASLQDSRALIKAIFEGRFGADYSSPLNPYERELFEYFDAHPEIPIHFHRGHDAGRSRYFDGSEQLQGLSAGIWQPGKERVSFIEYSAETGKGTPYQLLLHEMSHVYDGSKEISDYNALIASGAVDGDTIVTPYAEYLGPRRGFSSGPQDNCRLSFREFRANLWSNEGDAELAYQRTMATYGHIIIQVIQPLLDADPDYPRDEIYLTLEKLVHNPESARHLHMDHPADQALLWDSAIKVRKQLGRPGSDLPSVFRTNEHGDVVPVVGDSATADDANAGARMADAGQGENKRPYFLMTPEQIVLYYKGAGETLQQGRNTSIWRKLPRRFKDAEPVRGLPDDVEGLVVLAQGKQLPLWANTASGISASMEFVVSFSKPLTVEQLGLIRRGAWVWFQNVRRRLTFVSYERTQDDGSARTYRFTIKDADMQIFFEFLKDIGSQPQSIKRTRYGDIDADGMRPGEFRRVDWEELLSLMKALQMNEDAVEFMARQHERVIREEGVDRRLAEKMLQDPDFVRSVFNDVFGRADLDPADIRSKDILHIGEGGFKRVYEVILDMPNEPSDLAFALKIVKPDVLKTDSGYKYDREYTLRMDEVASTLRSHFLHLYPPSTRHTFAPDESGAERIISAEALVPAPQSISRSANRDQAIAETYMWLYRIFGGKLFVADPKKQNVVLRRIGRKVYRGTLVDRDNLILDNVSDREMLVDFLHYGFSPGDLLRAMDTVLGSEATERILANASSTVSMFLDAATSKEFYAAVREYSDGLKAPGSVPRPAPGLPAAIQIMLNGMSVSVPEGSTVGDVLADRGMDPEALAGLVVEANGQKIEDHAAAVVLNEGVPVRFWRIKDAGAQGAATDQSAAPDAGVGRAGSTDPRVKEIMKELASFKADLIPALESQDGRYKAFANALRRLTASLGSSQDHLGEDAGVSGRNRYASTLQALQRVDFKSNEVREHFLARFKGFQVRISDIVEKRKAEAAPEADLRDNAQSSGARMAMTPEQEAKDRLETAIFMPKHGGPLDLPRFILYTFLWSNKMLYPGSIPEDLNERLRTGDVSDLQKRVVMNRAFPTLSTPDAGRWIRMSNILGDTYKELENYGGLLKAGDPEASAPAKVKEMTHRVLDFYRQVETLALETAAGMSAEAERVVAMRSLAARDRSEPLISDDDLREYESMARRWQFNSTIFRSYLQDEPPPVREIELSAWLEALTLEGALQTKVNPRVPAGSEETPFKLKASTAPARVRTSPELLHLLIERVLSNGFHAKQRQKVTAPAVVRVVPHPRKGFVRIQVVTEGVFEREELLLDDPRTSWQRIVSLNSEREETSHSIGMPTSNLALRRISQDAQIRFRTFQSRSGRPHVETSFILPMAPAAARMSKSIRADDPMDLLSAEKRAFLEQGPPGERIARFDRHYAAIMAGSPAYTYIGKATQVRAVAEAFKFADLETAVADLKAKYQNQGITTFSFSDIARQMFSYRNIGKDADRYTLLSKWFRRAGLKNEAYDITPNARSANKPNQGAFYFADGIFGFSDALAGQIKAVGNTRSPDATKMTIIPVAGKTADLGSVAIINLPTHFEISYQDPLTGEVSTDRVEKTSPTKKIDLTVSLPFIRFSDRILGIPRETNDGSRIRSTAIRDQLIARVQPEPDSKSHTIDMSHTVLMLPDFYRWNMDLLKIYKDQKSGTHQICIVEKAHPENYIVFEVRRIDGRECGVNSENGKPLEGHTKGDGRFVCRLSQEADFRKFDEAIDKRGEPIEVAPTTETGRASMVPYGRLHVLFHHRIPLKRWMIRGSKRTNVTRDDFGDYPLELVRPDGGSIRLQRIDKKNRWQYTVSGLTWKKTGKPVLLTLRPGSTSFNLSVIAELVRKTPVGDWIQADPLFLDTFDFLELETHGGGVPRQNGYIVDPAGEILTQGEEFSADRLARDGFRIILNPALSAQAQPSPDKPIEDTPDASAARMAETPVSQVVIGPETPTDLLLRNEPVVFVVSDHKQMADFLQRAFKDGIRVRNAFYDIDNTLLHPAGFAGTEAFIRMLVDSAAEFRAGRNLAAGQKPDEKQLRRARESVRRDIYHWIRIWESSLIDHGYHKKVGGLEAVLPVLLEARDLWNIKRYMVLTARQKEQKSAIHRLLRENGILGHDRLIRDAADVLIAHEAHRKDNIIRSTNEESQAIAPYADREINIFVDDIAWNAENVVRNAANTKAFLILTPDPSNEAVTRVQYLAEARSAAQEKRPGFVYESLINAYWRSGSQPERTEVLDLAKVLLINGVYKEFMQQIVQIDKLKARSGITDEHPIHRVARGSHIQIPITTLGPGARMAADLRIDPSAPAVLRTENYALYDLAELPEFIGDLESKQKFINDLTEILARIKLEALPSTRRPEQTDEMYRSDRLADIKHEAKNLSVEIQRLPNNGGGFRLAADRTGRIIGFGVFWIYDGSNGRIEHLYVLPDRQKQGIGLRLMSHMLAALKKSGAAGAQWTSTRDAVRSYQRILQDLRVPFSNGPKPNEFYVDLSTAQTDRFTEGEVVSGNVDRPRYAAYDKVAPAVALEITGGARIAAAAGLTGPVPVECMDGARMAYTVVSVGKTSRPSAASASSPGTMTVRKPVRHGYESVLRRSEKAVERLRGQLARLRLLSGESTEVVLALRSGLEQGAVDASESWRNHVLAILTSLDGRADTGIRVRVDAERSDRKLVEFIQHRAPGLVAQPAPSASKRIRLDDISLAGAGVSGDGGQRLYLESGFWDAGSKTYHLPQLEAQILFAAAWSRAGDRVEPLLGIWGKMANGNKPTAQEALDIASGRAAPDMVLKYAFKALSLGARLAEAIAGLRLSTQMSQIAA